MIHLGAHTRVFLAAGATDMRKAIDGLSVLVQDVLSEDPLSSHVFVFCNRAKDKLKLLFWHNNGFWLCYRRLERERFWWPDGGDDTLTVELSVRELGWLLEGLDVTRVQGHKQQKYVLY
jgi:transposase